MRLTLARAEQVFTKVTAQETPDGRPEEAAQSDPPKGRTCPDCVRRRSSLRRLDSQNSSSLRGPTNLCTVGGETSWASVGLVSHGLCGGQVGGLLLGQQRGDGLDGVA